MFLNHCSFQDIKTIFNSISQLHVIKGILGQFAAIYHTVVLISMFVLPTYKYFPKYTLGVKMFSNHCSFQLGTNFSAAQDSFLLKGGPSWAVLGQNVQPLYSTKFLISIITWSTNKYFPKYTHGVKMFSNLCRLQLGTNFSAAQGRFFLKGGLSRAILGQKGEPLYVAKFLFLLLQGQHIHFFPEVSKCSSIIVISSWE